VEVRTDLGCYPHSLSVLTCIDFDCCAMTRCRDVRKYGKDLLVPRRSFQRHCAAAQRARLATWLWGMWSDFYFWGQTSTSQVDGTDSSENGRSRCRRKVDDFKDDPLTRINCSTARRIGKG
jgi:hypothetical protein